MSITYTPSHSYYFGAPSSKQSNVYFYAFNVQPDRLICYTFQVFNTTNNFVVATHGSMENLISFPSSAESYKLANAATFMAASVNASYTDSSALSKPPFTTNSSNDGTKYVLMLKDLVGVSGYNFYNVSNYNSYDHNTTYLLPISISTPIVSSMVANADPNTDFSVTLDSKSSRLVAVNKALQTKTMYTNKFNFNYRDIITLNTGMGNVSNLLNCNLLVSPTITQFISNIVFYNDLKLVNNNSYIWDNRLTLKLDGPITANVGDVVEYTVTLMNSALTDTFDNVPANIEVYPTTDAGVLSHRKVNLVNGVGKFKLNTSNLYSGEAFYVKVGWKYITGESQIRVTMI
jgi:hypothetical protein